MRRMAAWRIWPARMALLLVATLIGVALAEAVVAWAAPQWTWRRLMDGQARHFALLDIFEPCDLLPFRLRPGARGTMHGVEFDNTWTINRAGMRGSERSLQKTRSCTRVLALGDSFTAGHGVEAEQAWPAVVETILDREDHPVEVLNAGYAAGYSPDCYYAYLAKYADVIRPDVVVVALFAGNDIFEMLQHAYPRTDEYGLPLAVLAPTRWVDETGRRRLSQIDRPWAYRYPILRDSHLWIMACRAVGGGMEPSRPGHSPFRRDYSPAMRDEYGLSLRLLDGIRRVTESKGGQLLVAIIPDVGQLNGQLDYWQQATSAPDRDLDHPQSLWLRDLASMGIDAFDLRPALQQAIQRHGNDEWKVYYQHDRHLTSAGQRAVAEAVAERLQATSGAGRTAAGRTISNGRPESPAAN